MKWRVPGERLHDLPSPPSRGAWIEIVSSRRARTPSRASPPSRGAWIEIQTEKDLRENTRSPPSRGAWIEMLVRLQGVTGQCVAPLAGGVD